MRRTSGPRVRRVWWWRWRRNDLRRRSDRVEAWIVLIGWILALVGGLCAALVTRAAVADGLAERRAQADPVAAVITENAPRTPSADDLSDGSVWAEVRWTDSSGDTRTGLAKVEPGREAGSSVTVWTRDGDELVAAPPSTTQARFESALLGAWAGLAAAGAAVGCGRLARKGLDRRRVQDWETEWASVGPRWRRRMNG
ncbi:hypothetical protein STRCI_000555 [Streptomyces cinnabarinus]|uniref:Integral membrane protein n=1 Tax=Streptomyces cinnabarinus TaxID=67287 RepID=A0ABY7K4S2_9ACTN|nr:hypothetical protein [Streptomyces cinnabarinus]WAZ19500.1 hypothetical protein STRCI_000555 [Streptomyces cinnabarinus]